MKKACVGASKSEAAWAKNIPETNDAMVDSLVPRYASIVDELRDQFQTGQTRPVAHRKEMVMQVYICNLFFFFSMFMFVCMCEDTEDCFRFTKERRWCVCVCWDWWEHETVIEE